MAVVKPESRTLSVWAIVSQSGVYERMKAIAEAKKADWQKPSWSVADVTHQAVEKLAEQHRLPDPSDKKAFDKAFRVALERTLIDRHRKKKTQKRGFGRIRVVLSQLTTRAVPTNLDEDEARAILKEYEMRRPRQTLILWMRAIQDFSYAEIAETLGLTLDQVKAALRLAKAELKEQLIDHAP